MRDIGKNIRDLRERAGLTQEQLAERLFVTRQTVSNYENGRTGPDVDMVIKIGELLNADANTVLYGLPVPPERKRSVLRLCVTGGAALLLLAAWIWVQTVLRCDNYYYFTLTGLRFVFRILITPAALFLLGYTVVGAVALALGLRVPGLSWVRWVRWGILGVSLLCLASLLPYAVFNIIADIRGLLQDSVNMTFSGIPVLSDIAWGLMRLNQNYSALWAIPGAVLALLHREK